MGAKGGKQQTIIRPREIPNEHMRKLLENLRGARDAVEALIPEYTRALKHWADVERGIEEGHVALCDALLARYGLRDMTEAYVEHILKTTSDRPNHVQAWNHLARLAQVWDDAVRDLNRAQSQYLSYAELIDSEEDRPPPITAILREYVDDGTNDPPMGKP